VKEVAGAAGKIKVALANANGEDTIEGTHLLVAAGRTPNVADLGLEAAGIKHDRRGIVVNARLRTTNKRVYAVGVGTGRFQLPHVANYHAGLVVRNALFRFAAKVNRDIVPWVTFTDPELAHVGLSEAEAKKRKFRFSVLRWPYHENDR